MNKKFVLVSESDVPLYPPQVMYMQLMMETSAAGINACKNEGVRGLSPPGFFRSLRQMAAWQTCTFQVMDGRFVSVAQRLTGSGSTGTAIISADWQHAAADHCRALLGLR